jgi:hypothetical protein
MSFMSVGGARSATKHAGVPAIETTSVAFAADAAGTTQIVATPGDGRKIRLLGYNITTPTTTLEYVNISSSASTGGTGTSLTGQMPIADYALTQVFRGIGDCAVGEDLCISSTDAGVGLITYSLVP